MKFLKSLLPAITAVGLFSAVTLFAADVKKADKPKPYLLKTCAVSDEKLGEMGDPYVFTHEGREVKLCCEGCLKEFKKNPAKFVKKMEKADKPEKK